MEAGGHDEMKIPDETGYRTSRRWRTTKILQSLASTPNRVKSRWKGNQVQSPHRRASIASYGQSSPTISPKSTLAKRRSGEYSLSSRRSSTSQLQKLYQQDQSIFDVLVAGLKALNTSTEPLLEDEVILAALNATLKIHFGHADHVNISPETAKVWLPTLSRIIVKEKASKKLGRKSSVEGVENQVKMAFSTGTLDLFLNEVNNILQNGSGPKLASYLIIEPPYGELYQKMIVEVRQRFPKGNEEALERKVSALLSAARNGIDGTPWIPFVKFIVPYLGFLRDVNLQNLLDTYDLFSDVVQKCNAALSHPTMGVIVLPTIVNYSKILARLAIGLDKQPELTAHLAQTTGDDEGGQETLPERAANILVAAFKTCLADRTSTSSGFGGKMGKPEGKKVGIYTIANVCLKILFQCNKTRNAEHIFTNIYKQSPPLAIYPRQDRITYLYYLGRYHFQNGHYYQASQCLNEAYRLCPITFPRQRRLCLIYLLTANLLLGRFPTAALLSREEAIGLADRFNPLIRTIKLGDLQTFRALTSFHAPHAPWFLHFRILVPLQSKAETLVLRTLIRRTFLLAGHMGDAERRIAPTLDLEYVLHLWRWMEKRILSPLSVLDGGPGKRHTNWIFMGDDAPAAARYVDPEFEGIEELQENDEEGGEWSAAPMLPDMMEVESLFAGMIEMGLLNGFVSHRQLRFAITGARQKGALSAGFPPPWEAFTGRAELDEVPGWKRERKSAFGSGRRASFGSFGGQIGPGTVINLSGARPAGSGFA